MTLAQLLLILAIIIFVIGAFDAGRWRVHLVSLGLAFLAGAMFVGGLL